jgi:branched-chain amino acid transport system ATP-binding protein
LATDILILENVNAHYGDSHILHDINFSLKQGQLLTLLGRNGAGKTTTMLTLSGLLKASSGKIHLNAKELHKLQPEFIARAGVRLVPQGRRVFANLSVYENLIIAAQNRKIPHPWSVERVYELFPQLKDHQTQKAGTLSGGEQQMLVIGRALMGNPDVLLLDEPSEGLAPLIVNEVTKGIAKLKEDGLSIILVEQNFNVAMQLADYFVVLNTGYIAFKGESAEVRANPQSVTQHLGVF